MRVTAVSDGSYRPLLYPVLGLWVGLHAAACDSSSDGYSISIEFEQTQDAESAVWAEVGLVPDCGTQTLGASSTGERVVTVRRTQVGEPLGDVEPGTYGLYGRAVGDGCQVIAAGCRTVTVEAGGTGGLSVVLTPIERALCEPHQVCIDGECVAAPILDGGVRDAAGPGSGAAVVSSRSPYGDNGGGRWGVFVRANGDLLTLTRDSWSTIYVNRSTDNGATWTADVSNFNFSDPVYSAYGVMDTANDTLWVAVQTGDTNRVLLKPYYPASNTWGTTETVSTHSNGNGPGFGVAALLAADGTIYVQFQDDHANVGGTNYRRVSLAERTAANTFTIHALDDGGSVHWTTGDLFEGTDGLIYALYGSWQTRAYVKTFDTSTNTLSAAAEVSDTAAPFAVNAARRLAAYESGGDDVVIATWRGPSGYPYYSTMTNGGTPSAEAAIAAAELNVWDGDNSAGYGIAAVPWYEYAVAVFASGGDVYLYDNSAGSWASAGGFGLSSVRWADVSVYVTPADEIYVGVLWDAGAGLNFEAIYLDDVPASGPVELDATGASG